MLRGVVEKQQTILEDFQDARKLATYTGQGASGDMTLAIDAAFEKVILDSLRSHANDSSTWHLVSEEVGEAKLGSQEEVDPLWIVIDPIDGSENVKRGLPSCALSVALARGPSMNDVFFGYVFDFGTREEWVAGDSTSPMLNGSVLNEGEIKNQIDAALRSENSSSMGLVALESAAPRYLAPVMSELASSTSFSLISGFWQNAVLNTVFAVLFAAPLTALLISQKKALAEME